MTTIAVDKWMNGDESVMKARSVSKHFQNGDCVQEYAVIRTESGEIA